MIAESYNIVQEAYFAIVMDRDMGGPVLVCCKEGGVDIEELAQHSPHLICKVPVDISTGITEEQALKAATHLGLPSEKQTKEAADQIQKLFHLFCRVDATQVEINPFGKQ